MFLLWSQMNLETLWIGMIELEEQPCQVPELTCTTPPLYIVPDWWEATNMATQTKSLKKMLMQQSGTGPLAAKFLRLWHLAPYSLVTTK